MRKLSIFMTLCILALAVATSCKSKNPYEEIESAYKEWNAENQRFLDEMKVKTQADGSLYFEKVSPDWNPDAYVLIHYFNDRSETANNLSPMYTSTVDTRYYLTYCDGTPIDSSYTQTKWGPGIFRTKLSEVVSGWAIALETMHVGDTVELIIPYESAYGTSSTTVMPFSNLKFNLRLVDIYSYETNPK